MSPIRSGVCKQGARIYIVRARPGPPRVTEQKDDRVAYAVTIGGHFVISGMALYETIRCRCIARNLSETLSFMRDEIRDTGDDGQLHEA